MSTSTEQIAALILAYADLKGFFESLRDGFNGRYDTSIAVTDLDAIEQSGFYSYNVGATGAPNTVADGRVLHIQEGLTQATQIAVVGIQNISFRDKDNANGWGSWQRIWNADYADSKVREILDEYGLGSNPSITDLDAHTQGGFYRFGSAATGIPLAGYDGKLIHVEGRDGERSQIAVAGASQLAIRDKDSAINPYSPWKFAWIGQQPSASLSSSGYQILPSGLIIQWGSGNAGDSPFPMAFPNACFKVIGSDQDNTAEAVAISGTATTVTIVTTDPGAVHYIAIGH